MSGLIESAKEDLKDLYSKARNREDFEKVWQVGKDLAADMNRQEFLSVDIYKSIMPALWARYYLAKKFGKKEDDILNFYNWVGEAWEVSRKAADTELIFSSGYLLSAIKSQLQQKIEEADEINREMEKLVKDIGDTAAALKVINAEGLAAMQRREWPEAIHLFDRVKKLFPDARKVPVVCQHLANIYNNRGLSWLNLSDEVKQSIVKRGFIFSAIWDLNEAAGLYMGVVPPPLKHIQGVENRLIISVSKLLIAGRELKEEEIGKKIKEIFSAGNKKEAREIILNLIPAEIRSEYKTDGDVLSGDIMLFIESVQKQLIYIDKFLKENS